MADEDLAPGDGALRGEYEALKRAIKDGSLVSATKAELERYATILARGEAIFSFQPDRLAQAGETVRLLLLVRLSEQSQSRALAIAKAALWIALASTVVQVLMGLGCVPKLGPY